MLPRLHSRSDGWLCAGVVLLAVLTVPQMLCLPLTADTQHYDIQADCALNGGVLYRDVLEPNLPGVVWVHMLVRGIAGWSSEVMRAFDLLVLLGIAILLIHCLNFDKRNDAARSTANDPLHAGCMMLVIWCCYVSLPEWCHCQRDIWMLLPALGAVSLRLHRMRSTSPRWWMSSRLEGLLWGTAFWLKPFVAIPAIAVWICWAWMSRSRRAIVKDAAGLIAGGLIAGAIGVAWLWSTGAWGPFWDVATNWNPEYFASRQNRWSLDRIATLYEWLSPWWWAHLVALPIAVGRIVRWIRSGRAAADTADGSQAIMSAFYLGWVIQVMCLQHPLLYIHASGVLIALGIAGDAVLRRLQARTEFRPLLAGGLAMLVLSTQAIQLDRLACWWTCLREGPTEVVQDALQQSPIVDHTQLTPIVDFLRNQELRDGELTVYSGYLVGLYRQLDLSPSTRFVLLDVEARVFPSRVSEMADALGHSRQRFVVTNLLESGFNPDELGDADSRAEPSLPKGFPSEHLTEFPYNQRLVLRSGPYLVHEVVAPVGSITTEYLPLAN